MSAITTHVLDTLRGRPAVGLAVRLEKKEGHAWIPVGSGTTDADGRQRGLTPVGVKLEAGIYRLTFETEEYFRSQRVPAFYPEVAVSFQVRDPLQLHHVPLLLAPFGFTTYRGS
jgi:5-hydroxyisourate hydrolase